MNQTVNTADDTIDLKALVLSLLAQWKLILLCTILSLILGILYLRATTPVYAVDALVQVEDGKSAASKALLGELGDLAGAAGGKSAADAEIEILRSRAVLGQVIQDLHLDIAITDPQNTLWHNMITPPKEQRVYNQQGVSFSENHQSFGIEQLDVPKYYQDKPLQLHFLNSQQFTLAYQDEVVFKGNVNQLNTLANAQGVWAVKMNGAIPGREFIIKKMSLPAAMQAVTQNYSVAEKGKNSGVLSLSYQGDDKEHIAKVLNAILDVYHAQNIDRRTLESKQTLSFLDKQLPDLKNQLEQSELRFNQFREQNNTVDVTQESQLLLKQNIELDTAKFELKRKQAELAAKYTDDFPLMAEINAQLAAMDQKTQQLDTTLKRLPELQRQYLQLYRDVEVNTQLYTALLNSYQQLKVAQAGEIGNVRIIDHAVEPVKPIKPKKPMILALSLLGGLFLGTLLALARNLFRSGIVDSKQIEDSLDLPVYAAVPRSPIQENRVKILRKKKTLPILAHNHSDDIAIESLRSIRTTIHFALANAKNNVIMISGPAPEVGKSFVTANLATIFAQNNKRVLVIDGDLRRGYLHKYFDQAIEPGLAEYLIGKNTLEQILKATLIENLTFISRGRSPGKPSELLASQQFEQLVQTLSSQFDYIIIDSPPVLAVTDPAIISRYTGINLLVARFGVTHLQELEMAESRFNHAGTKIDGVILNDVQRSSSSGYTYNYNYAYTAAKDD